MNSYFLYSYPSTYEVRNVFYVSIQRSMNVYKEKYNRNTQNYILFDAIMVSLSWVVGRDSFSLPFKTAGKVRSQHSTTFYWKHTHTHTTHHKTQKQMAPLGKWFRLESSTSRVQWIHFLLHNWLIWAIVGADNPEEGRLEGD